ncbi:MAG: hypothetical protein IJX34_02570 [Clostridia bacterium]|nr:hypothetical protein [Clostridia bacterium]
MIAAMIFMIVILIGFIILLFATNGMEVKKRKRSKKATNVKANSSNSTNQSKKNDDELVGIKRNSSTQGLQRKDVFDFMEFDSVEDDMIIQNSGNRYTMVIQCKGINYDLMSDIEQLAVEEGFIVFLNTLKYPIQLFVQARSVDLKKSMSVYNQRVKMFEKQFTEYDEAFRKKINTLDATPEEVDIARTERAKFANIYEYAQDINKYVERLSMNKNILQRKFYIAISYARNEITASGSFSKEEIREICHRELYTRANTLISSLMSCSVVGRTLTSEELIELLFVSYNRDDERLFDISTALDADFYRLYSTSKDIYDKKREKIQEEISKEAIRRVQDAIKATVRQDQIKTEEEIEDEFEESVDREAVNIIREAEIDNETKEILTNEIATNHVINSKKRYEQRKKKQEQLEDQNLYNEETIENEELYTSEEDSEKDDDEEII